MKKFTLFSVFLCFIAYGNTTKHEWDPRSYSLNTSSEMVSILDNVIASENITSEIEALFHKGFHIGTTTKMRAWVEEITNLDSAKYVQYLNYWAYYDARKYKTNIDTALIIMLQRIPLSLKFFGKMPNKLTDAELAQLGNAMINCHLIVAVDSKTWIHSESLNLSPYLDMSKMLFDPCARYIDSHVSVEILDNFTNNPYYEVVHYDLCRLMAAAQLNIIPVTNTKKVVLRYDLGAVLIAGGERFILSQLKFESS